MQARRWNVRQKWQWATLVLVALLPLTPSMTDPVSLGFALSFGVLTLKNLQTRSRMRSAPYSTYFLIAFYLIAVASLTTAVSLGTSVGTWFRGLIPFLFLTSYFCIQGFSTLDDLQDALDGIQLAACVWAARIIVLCGPDLIDVMTGQLGRLTYACMDTLIPFGLIGYLVTLTNPSPRFAQFRWPLLGVFALLVVACAYRSHMLLCALATIVFLYRSGAVVFARVLMVCAAGALLAGFVAGDKLMTMWDNVGVRFHSAINSQDLGTRGWEIQYARGEFLKSPLWGNGLGHQVPIDVIHDLSAVPDADVEGGSAGYIHNVWMYMLMDLGAPGFAMYLLYFLTPIFGAIASVWRRDRLNDLQFCSLVTTVCLLIYTSCQAAFRLIQFNVVLGLLAAVLCFSIQSSRQSRPCGARSQAAC